MVTTVGVVVDFKSRIDGSLSAGFRTIQATSDKLTASAALAGKAFNSVTSSIAGSVKQLATFGVLSAGVLIAGAIALERYIGKVGDSIDKITDDSRGLNISADSLQKMAYAANLSGVSLEELEGNIKKMGLSIGQLGTGNEQVTASFNRLGLTFSQLKGKSADQQFLQIASALDNIKDKNLQAEAAFTIFGKSYTTVLSMIRDGIKENIAEFNKMGLALSDSQRKAVDSFGDSKDRLGAIWEGFGQKIVANVAPAFGDLTKWIGDSIVQMGGIDKAAKSFAASIVDGVAIAVKSFGALLDILDDVSIRMTKINIYFEELALARMKSADEQKDQQPLNAEQINGAYKNATNQSQIDTLNRQSVLVPIPSMDTVAQQNKVNSLYAIQNAAEKSQGSRGDALAPAVNILEKGANDLRQNRTPVEEVVNSATKLSGNFNNLGTGADLVAEKLSKASDGFQNLFDSQKSQATSNLIGKIVTGAGIKPQADDEKFNSLASSVLKNFQEGSNKNGTLIQSGLATLDSMVKYASPNMDNSGQKGALDELKKLIGVSLDKKQTVDVNVKVEPSPDFYIRYSTNKDVQEANRKQQAASLALAAKSMGTR